MTDFAPVGVAGGLQIDPIGVVGVVVVVVGALGGYYVLHSVIPTIARQREAIRETSRALILHAPFIFNPGAAPEDDVRGVSDALRGCAANLSASTEAVSLYRVFARLRLVRRRDAIEIAHRSLIGLSNSIGSGDPMWNAHRVADLEDALGLGTNLGHRRGDFEDEE